MAAAGLVGSAQSLFRNLAQGLAKQGFSANAMINRAKELGISYRRTSMLETTRWATGLSKLEAAVRRVAGDVMFPQYAMVPSSFRAARRYLIHATMSFVDPLTGESVKEHISFFSNERMTKDQWLKDWFEKAAWTDSKDLAARHAPEIVSVEHKMGWDI